MRKPMRSSGYVLSSQRAIIMASESLTSETASKLLNYNINEVLL
jgi:hypothetical protein